MSGHTIYLDTMRLIMGTSSAITNHTNLVTLKRIKIYILEMEDVLFHLNSAVMMPENPEGKSSDDSGGGSSDQEQISGLSALGLVFKQFEFDYKKRMIIAGHTDTSGQPKDNFDLSKERAENILYLLTGDKVKWAQICENRHKVEDYQQIMKFFAEKNGIACAPGKIDNKWGDKTENATKEFLKTTIPEKADALLNEIKSDSKKKWPEEVWQAVYDLYIKHLCKILGVLNEEQLNKKRNTIKYVNDSMPYVSCGESFPIDSKYKKNYRSQKNRRVEILFFDKDEIEAEAIKCPPARTTVHKEEECPLWNMIYFLPLHIDPKDLTSTVYHIKFAYYNNIQKKVLSVPGGLKISAYKDDTTKIPTATVYKNDVYYVKVQFDKSETPETLKNLHFKFETDSGYIYTKDNKSETKPVIKSETDILLENSLSKIEELPFLEQMKYYDLPKKWSSKNYWTRYDGDMNKGDTFEKVMKEKAKLKPFDQNITKPDKPLIFSLDDIVLTKEDGCQDIKDQDENGNDISLSATPLTAGNARTPCFSRFSLFHIDNEELKLYKPLNANAPYFSNITFDKNVITDVPSDTRLIIFCNGFYPVWKKRSAQGSEPFDASKHIQGCRAAQPNDSTCYRKIICDSGNNTHGHQRYFAWKVGNFELHYLHNGCPIKGPDKLEMRTFLIIFWTSRFKSHPTNSVNIAKVVDFATKGLKNAKERWESKGYSIDSTDTSKSKIQIRPVFYFEAKDSFSGGKPKCEVTVSNDPSTGWMGRTTSEMYWEDYADRDYLNIGQKFTDIDGKIYETLVVAHEFGHATGKYDEYAYETGGIGAWAQKPNDGPFSQYYLGMPYRFDAYLVGGSLMNDNRAPRMRQLWHFVNWINEASLDNNQLKPFLNNANFKIVHRYGSNRLDYFLSSSPNDYRDVYEPFRTTRNENVSTGTVDIALYKIGMDETSKNIKINNKPTSFAFDGIVVVYIKMGIKFTIPIGSTATWSANDKKTWKNKIRKHINNLNGRFYLEDVNGTHDFKRVYIHFFPICLDDPYKGTNLQPYANYNISIAKNNSSRIASKRCKNLRIGEDTSPSWVANYVLGKDNGAFVTFFKRILGSDAPGKSNVEIVRKWFKSKFTTSSLSLKGS